MKPFIKLTGVAAPLPFANVDTDKIIPARFMKTIKRSGLGKNLFDALRYANGEEVPEFVLNKPQFKNAGILITFENFGCGSSREHAPWALLDFGIRCIIAPSFADIFHNNCLKNGILPICLPHDTCEDLMANAELGENARMTIDLELLRIVKADGNVIPFHIDPAKRRRLLQGWDDVDETLKRSALIDVFERRRTACAEWELPDLPQSLGT
ncbi:3-isopropylmalate dehydratase small subunit [Xanthobacter dioxanivorans]|uniref:3-isopropylmalate dehydratase small subunit n=1 Tax=Xanthobacter dioxanivorans TaxID=2528964 RepID=A0A974PMW6_9HYPH|nr:3-isopropylmalate dehydratase small subunit [Xanthobacter dioxanivorans]QRG06243.1 3-isopropylmalate dehydratase small subunit [Xanthobacter dioxanivorans]